LHSHNTLYTHVRFNIINTNKAMKNITKVVLYIILLHGDQKKCR